MYTRDKVIRAVKNVFSKHRIENVLDLLDLYGKEAHEYEKERVQLAIIKISRGDMLKLREYINLAKIDYRDVLMSAEYNQDGLEIKGPYEEMGISEQ